MPLNAASKIKAEHIIVGAGISGILAAFSFEKIGVPVSVYDRRPFEDLVARAQYDKRLISISAFNAQFLQEAFDLSSTLCVKKVYFFVGGSSVYVHKQSMPIAYLFSYSDLYRLLASRVSARVIVGSYEPDNTLESQPVVFACDGKNSHMRQKMNIPMHDSFIRQRAFLGRVKSEYAYAHEAFECFLPQGVLTLLPENDGVFSFIWHVNQEYVPFMGALDEKGFVRLMQKYVPDVPLIALLGSYVWRDIAPACATRFYANNIYLCGDAAHTLHPLSGQSLNVYIEALRGLSAHYQDPFDYDAWSYIYWKHAHNMFRSTSFLNNFFCSERFLAF